jgi:hypothetical protein
VAEVVVRTIEDWSELRRLRLAAVEESPRAFIADPAAEAARSPAAWRDVLDRGHWLAAVDGGPAIGLSHLVDHGHLRSCTWSPSGWRRRIAGAASRAGC